MLHFFAYAEIIFAHILVFPACAIEMQHINENSPTMKLKFLFYSKPIHPGHFSTSFLSRGFLNYLIFVNLSTFRLYNYIFYSLRANSPFGGYCEKQTSEMHMRGDAKVGVGGAPFLGTSR